MLYIETAFKLLMKKYSCLLIHEYTYYLAHSLIVQSYLCIHSLAFASASFFICFSFIFISWRLISLQYCSGFCHTLTWISHGFTCIPHPDPPPTSLSIRSLWIFPVHQARALVSCIQPGLVICFTLNNIRFNAVLSKHPTLAFSHRVQKSVLYICVSFSVLHIGLSLTSF